MAKLSVLVGCPGSGKSTFIEHFKEYYSGIRVQDFHSNAINHSPLFVNSRHYQSLINNLMEGKNCIIADIEYCRVARRQEVQDEIDTVIHNTEIEWIYFENDPSQCIRNVEKRNRPSKDEEIRKIRELSAQYQIPVGSKIIPVVRPAMDFDQEWN